MNKLLERKKCLYYSKTKQKNILWIPASKHIIYRHISKSWAKRNQLKSPNSRRNPLKIEHQSIMTEQNLNISKSLNDYSKNVYTIVNMNQINGKTRDTSIHGMRMFIISIHTWMGTGFYDLSSTRIYLEQPTINRLSATSTSHQDQV